MHDILYYGWIAILIDKSCHSSKHVPMAGHLMFSFPEKLINKSSSRENEDGDKNYGNSFFSR